MNKNPAWFDQLLPTTENTLALAHCLSSYLTGQLLQDGNTIYQRKHEAAASPAD